LLKQLKEHHNLLKTVQNYIDPNFTVQNPEYSWQSSLFSIASQELKDSVYGIVLGVPVHQWP
jgi:hypothetical protein